MRKYIVPDESFWKLTAEVPGYPGYRVDYRGEVYSRIRCGGICKDQRGITWNKWTILKKSKTVYGYYKVTLYNTGGSGQFLVHRLVLELFVGPEPLGCFGLHNDGNPLNNYVLNLRWDTPKENQLDRAKHGTSNRGERNWKAKLTADDVREIRRLKSSGVSRRDIASQFNLNRDWVSAIVRKAAWKHI